MGIQAHYLEDKDGNKFYAVAHAQASYDKNGITIQKRLDDLAGAASIIYLSQADYQTLITTGTVTTESGDTYVYDDVMYYAVKEDGLYKGKILIANDTTATDVPTKTSELTNDGEDGTNKFITNQVSDLANYYNKTTIDTSLGNKQDKITSTNKLDYSLLDNTPSIPSGTVTSVEVKMNGVSKGTITSSGTIDLGTVITDISGKADKATTLSGYGITDAKISNGTITLGSNTITPVTDISGKQDKITDSNKLAYTLISGTPTKLSEFTNDSNFITNAVSDLTNYYKKTETYTQTEINEKISAIPKFAIAVVDSLPTSGISTTTVYLLKTSTTETGNLYTEYIYVNSAWEKLGTQTLDLTNYVQKNDSLSVLSEDTTHRLVTDTEKATWNAKQSALTSAQLSAVNSGITATKVSGYDTDLESLTSRVDTIDDSLLTFDADDTESVTPSPYIAQSDVVNNLTSSSTTAPLSAYQGRLLNEKITNDGLPTYYDDYLEGKIQTILGLQSTMNSDSFVYITDYHMDYSDTPSYSPAIIKQLMEKTNARFVAFGGDGMTIGTTTVEVEEKIRKFIAEWDDSIIRRFYPVNGNHEWNNDKTPRLTQAQVYNTYYKQFTEDGSNTKVVDGMNYYFENPIQKIRYIMVSCTYTAKYEDDTLTWLSNTIKNTPSGWYIMIIAHRGFKTGTQQSSATGQYRMGTWTIGDLYTVFTDVIDAAAAESSATVIGVMVGHEHLDGMQKTTGGITVVATNCDNPVGDCQVGRERTLGTTNEQCFEVVTINLDTKTVNLTRIGAYDDRSWTF